ncbi:MAG TPA: hypothetical protein VK760_07865 [Candidatus Acidoferrales bacterium]|jgi:streptogramin lyase|nr:hypothetical protein [Candidatus Acidoferrales bacterium]
MNVNLFYRAALAVSVLLLAACGGAGGHGLVPSATLPLQREPERGSFSPVTVTVSIALPNSGDPNAQSARITLEQPHRKTHTATIVLKKTAPLCRPATTGIVCTYALSMVTGTAHYTLELYGPNKNLTYSGGQDFNPYSGSLPFVDTDVYTSTSLSYRDPTMGAPSRIPVSVTAYEDDDTLQLHGIVIGAAPYTKPIALVDTDKTGATKLSTLSVASPGTVVTLSYDGTSFVNPIVSTKPASSNGWRFEPILRATEYPLPNGRASSTNASTGRILANADGTMTFLAYEALETVTSSGQITEQRLPAYEYDIARGPDRRIWTIIQYAKGDALARVNGDGTLAYFPLKNYQYSPFVLGPDKNFWMYGSTSGGSPAAVRVTPKGVETTIRIARNEENLSNLVAGGDGNVWFTGIGGLLPDSNTGNVVKVKPNGGYTIYQIPGNAQPCCSPYVTNPILGADGKLYAVVGNTYLASVTPAGRFHELKRAMSLGGSGSSGMPSAMAFGPDGAVWYDAGSSYHAACALLLGRETTKGEVAFVQLPATCSTSGFPQGPTALAAGPGHALWYTRGDAVGKIQL